MEINIGVPENQRRQKEIDYILENTGDEDKTKPAINFRLHNTPLGAMISCYSEEALYLFEYCNRKKLVNQLTKLRKHFGRYINRENEISDTLDAQAHEYFQQKRKKFDIPLCYTGTDFQKQVWDILHTIPYGETISYQEQAERLGRPNAVRAVANANGQNQISIIVPCHRVIGSNRKLVGYGGGLERKRKLLEIENQHSRVSLTMPTDC